MKAQTEEALLEHMGAVYRAKGRTGPTAWSPIKTHALEVIECHAGARGLPLGGMIDLGIGDMRHLEKWRLFAEDRIGYTGVEGNVDIIRDAAVRHPTKNFRYTPFSVLMQEEVGADLVVALDVLFHIPDASLYHAILKWLFVQPDARYVLVSYSPSVVRGAGGAGPGTPGFGWIPRPFPRPPEEWESIHRATAPPGCGASLVLEAFYRGEV